MNTNSGRNLRALLALILGATLSSFAVAQTDTAASDNKAKEVKMEKFEVVGSRILRLDTEGPQPVVNFTNEDISARGFMTLGDFMQSLPFNSAGANSVIQTASFLRGADTINPRALGSGRFLVLINGRRAVSYALTDSNNRSVFDFNSLPQEAIDSIEYLKDGASAIYGSDAVTGVMNIKLKKSYSGLSTDLFLGNTLGHDTFTRAVNVLTGADNSKTSVMVDVNWFKQNSNYIRDYSRSKTTDYSFLGANKGANLNSSSNYPANLNLTAAQATAAGFTTGSGVYVITGGTPTANPTTSMFGKVATIPNENRYDFAQTYQLFPDREYSDVFAYFRHNFNDNISAFGQIVYTDNMTKYAFTPAVIASTSTFTSSGAALTLPSTNPYNPLGVTVTNFSYRTNFGPPRLFDTESLAQGLLGGLRGKIGENWTWETAFSYGSDLVTTVSRNQIKADSLQAALSGTTRATALNPFGPSDNQALVNALFTISNGSAKDLSWSYDATVTGSLFTMPALLGQSSAGDVSIAVGGEWRQEKLDSRPDTTAYVGSGGGSPFIGSRTVQSIYAELDVPVVRKFLEFQLAARHEHYNDFGKTTKPKFSFVSQPFSFLKLRGSYSQSFKAPDLGQLYTSRTTAFTSTVYTDPLRPQDPAVQLRIITGGNPHLQPENGKIWYGGAVFDLDKAVKGLNFTVDWFNFTINKVIVSYTSPSTLFTLFPDRVIRDNSGGYPGPIQYLEATPNNVAAYYYRGFDFGLDYTLRKTRLGDLNFGVQATRINYYGYDGGLGSGPVNYVHTYNTPRWAANAQIGWRYRKYGATLSGIYKGPYLNDGYTTATWGENPIAKLNLTLTYEGPWRTKFTLGVDNLLNTQPPVNGRETTGFDQSTYAEWALGRFVSLRVSKQF